MFVISGADFIRLWSGPLPSITCDIICFARNWFLMVCSATLSIQIIMRYHFVCKWKRIRVMKDNLIVRLVIICTFGGTIWLTFTKSYVFGEETVLKVNESRTCYNRTCKQATDSVLASAPSCAQARAPPLTRGPRFICKICYVKIMTSFFHTVISGK